jgi:NADPH:quinone reductase-like Zn-dependent oxidoreductase
MRSYATDVATDRFAPRAAIPATASPDDDAATAPARRHGRIGRRLQAMVDAIAASRVKPVIDRTFSFEQAKDAFSRMASGAHFGKVAIASEIEPQA